MEHLKLNFRYDSEDEEISVLEVFCKNAEKLKILDLSGSLLQPHDTKYLLKLLKGQTIVNSLEKLILDNTEGDHCGREIAHEEFPEIAKFIEKGSSQSGFLIDG